MIKFPQGSGERGGTDFEIGIAIERHNKGDLTDSQFHKVILRFIEKMKSHELFTANSIIKKVLREEENGRK